MVESRITREDEEAGYEQLGLEMGLAAWTGVFSGGKQVIRTEMQGVGSNRALALYFSDNSAIVIRGSFEIRFKDPQVEQPASIEDVFEGRILTEEDLGSV